MPLDFVTRSFPKISINDVPSDNAYRPIFYKAVNSKAKKTYRRISALIVGNRILDIGTGVGGNAAYLHKRGSDVKSLDVKDSSYFHELPTEMYPGDIFPYEDNSFDTAIIIHVIHHAEDRLQLLREAKRVAKRVVIIEDTYRNLPEHLVIGTIDSVFNGEFYWHPYNKPEKWREIFKEEGWKVLHEECYSDLVYNFLYGRYVIFAIE